MGFKSAKRQSGQSMAGNTGQSNTSRVAQAGTSVKAGRKRRQGHG